MKRGFNREVLMRSSLLRAFALFLVVLPRFVFAWDLSFIANGSLPSNFSPAIVTPADASGFWAGGTANGMPVLVRYNNNGTVNFSRYLSGSALFQGDIGGIFALATYPDGGVVDVDSVTVLGYSRCYMRRFDANGRLRWSIQEGSTTIGSGCVNKAQVDGAGNIWLSPGIRAIAPDGTRLPPIQGTTVGGQILVDPHSDAVYVYGSIGNGYLETTTSTNTAAIEKITSKALVWTVQASASTPASKLDSLAIGSDGNLYAYGRRVSGANGATTLYAMSATANGALRWEYSTEEVANGEIVAAAASNGDSVVFYGDYTNLMAPNPTASLWIAKISSSGAPLWRRTAGFQLPAATFTNSQEQSAAALVANNGDIVAAFLFCGMNAGVYTCPFQQARLDSGGNIVFAAKDLGSDSSSTASLTLLPDSSSLALKHSFVRLDRNGNSITAPQTVAAVQDASSDIAETVARDGSAYLLTSNQSTNSYAVTAYAKDGTKLWRTVLTAATANGTVTQAILVARSADVCLAGVVDAAQVVRCYSRSTGALSTSVQLATPVVADTQSLRAVALVDDQLLVLYGIQGTSNLHHALLDGQNHILHDVAALNAGETWGITSTNVNGSALIQTSTTSLVKFKADGTRAYSVAPDISGYSLRLADDESALLSPTAPGTPVERLDANGKLLWKSAIPLLSQSRRITTRSIRFSSSAVYFYMYDNSPINYVENATARQGYVVKLSQNDGHVEWSVAASFPFIAVADVVVPPILLLDPVTQNLLLLTSYAKKIQLRQINGVDGSEMAEHAESMNVDGFSLYDAWPLDGGGLTLVSDTTDTVTGSAWGITTLFHPFAVAAPIRIDQPGIAGAWYAPYSTGQGFTLDYIAGNNTVFMPWFTFTQTQANDPASNVWYTLQGQPDAGATSVDLKMYVADSPGVFNSGKTGAKQVGTAQLSFSDCSHGNLRYQFDANTNSGYSGAITLTRLTPQIANCTLANHATQTVPVSLPAQGFDAKQSGSWYDPNTSGQGIELTVVPAGSDSNGLLFGAWFTYDPAGKGDDPLNQYWFTLQSDLATASNGKVVLPIFQILGGTLDGLPTHNSSQVGTATLTFRGCAEARLDYQFADIAVAHAYAGLTGSLSLTKIGGCAAP
ncbi:hypothetical protein [Rudaea sp.]|uniref:hypothetical protein n=1 Tax=Rudaea sp. TaxID=2136325 RepID=UPI003784FDDE